MATEIALEKYLDKLEDIISPNHVERTRELHKKAFNFEPVDHIPTVIFYPIPEDEWPSFDFREIQHDFGKMLISELASVYAGAKLGDDRLYGIRANYGTGIIASMFGCQIVEFDKNLPLALHLSREQLDYIMDLGIPDLSNGIMGRVLETVAYYRETLSSYPKLSKLIGSQVFDIQGPFDNAHILWGPDIYVAIYEEPDNVLKLVELMTQTIKAAVKKQREIDGFPLDEHCCIWSHLGGLCVRLDSCVNLSRKHYEHFSKPFDIRLLGEWSGWIHFCGKANQWFDSLLDIPGLKGINISQGEYYDLKTIYESCEQVKIPLVQWCRPLNDEMKERIRTGFSRMAWVGSFDEALANLETLYKTGHTDV